MADFSKLFNRVNNNQANNQINNESVSNSSHKQRLVQISNKMYMRIRLDVFKHVGTSQAYWVNRALKYAAKHKIL